MFFRLLLLFIGVPILEMALLIRIGQDLGFWPTIGLIVFTGLLGSHLARQQGSAVWHQFNARLNAGELPGREIMNGLIVLMAGALLLTPGVITDFVGFLGLMPYTREIIRKYAEKRLKSAQAGGRIGVQFFGFEKPPFDPPKRDADTQWQGTAKNRPDYTD